MSEPEYVVTHDEECDCWCHPTLTPYDVLDQYGYAPVNVGHRCVLGVWNRLVVNHNER